MAVHPHACGEHEAGKLGGLHHEGSSPRLWGTRIQSHTNPYRCRFIPTPVGNTMEEKSVDTCVTVHPHACGEHFVRVFCAQKPLGSSPRLWGTLRGYVWQDVYLRFIPTPVGNTTICIWSNNIRTVHPHACGEHQTV